MYPVVIDTALNLIWLAAGGVALLLLLCLERRTFRRSRMRARLLRFAAVLTITVALFPSVSSSDDLFRFSYINRHFGKHGGAGSPIPSDPRKKSAFQLFRLLEAISHYQISCGYTLSLMLYCVAFVLTARQRTLTRAVLSRPGRAPPLI